MARWRLGRAALETGERDWAAAGRAIVWTLGDGSRAAAQGWARRRIAQLRQEAADHERAAAEAAEARRAAADGERHQADDRGQAMAVDIT
eukprot:4484833-Alexandrium_andersonii.AAC.1